MKKEYFNIGDYGEIYNDIDFINPNELKHISGDNIFLAFIKENMITSLNSVAAIDGKIYNFNTHKYLSNSAEILYAKAYSDIMPKEIWRLIYIVNYQIISIDVDDNKCYLINDFEDSYKDVYDKNAKKRILKNGYFTPKFQKKALLNKQNLENIKSSNIFIAVLENIAYSEKSFSEDENLINITYEGINELAFILEDMLKNEEIILPKGTSQKDWIETFKEKAIDELDRYWYFKTNVGQTVANFIASINGNIYNFCTNEYLDFNKTKINYVKPLKNLIPENKWKLSYSKSGKLICLTIDEEYLEQLIEFECLHEEDYDKEAKTKVLKNGYKINIGETYE